VVELMQCVKNKADRLFLGFTKEFALEFCKLTKSYHLKNPKIAQCHPLELFLISDKSFTGNKLKDLVTTSDRSFRWLLGFYHGYSGKIEKFAKSDYKEGYEAGKLMAGQNVCG
jgi:hypothetical protein